MNESWPKNLLMANTKGRKRKRSMRWSKMQKGVQEMNGQCVCAGGKRSSVIKKGGGLKIEMDRRVEMRMRGGGCLMN